MTAMRTKFTLSTTSLELKGKSAGMSEKIAPGPWMAGRYGQMETSVNE